MNEEHFKTSGNIIRLLGEQLVSNKFIAVLELVKNAYDADATEVDVSFELKTSKKTGKKIPVLSISDNGNGMTYKDITEKWLVLGTFNKERDKVSPSGRRLLGAKGIGRFAIQKLGETLNIESTPRFIQVTRTKAEIKKIKFSIDWNDVIDPNSTLDEYGIPIEQLNPQSDGTGTHITIKKLRDEWTKEDIDRLRQEIVSLLPPEFSVDFRVNFSHWKFSPNPTQLSSELLESATYSITGHADGKQKVFLKIGGASSTVDIDTSKCGPFQFEVYAFDIERVKDDYKGAASKILASLNDFNGIKIYRDDFRVKPYGDPNTDWLGLDQYRVKSINRFYSRNTIGIVKITSDENPRLVDQTNREGLINGPAFLQMQEALFQIVNQLSIRNVKWHAQHSTKGSLKKAAKVAKKSAKSPEAKQSVKDLVSTADKIIKSLEETNAELRGNASIGLSFLGFGHDLLEEAKLARALVREIISDCTDPDYVAECADGLKSHIEILYQFIQTLEEFGHVENREILSLEADDIVKLFFKRYAPLLKRTDGNIQLTTSYNADNSYVRVARRDLESVLINLTTNASQALQENEDDREISISTSVDKGKWKLTFSDSGPGVDPAVKKDLFERGVTTKKDAGGSGIGLNIVETTLQRTGGKIALEDVSELGGATFSIWLPLTRKNTK